MATILRRCVVDDPAVNYEPPPGIVFKPPIWLEDLRKDVGPDPEEAEALVALVLELRTTAL